MRVENNVPTVEKMEWVTKPTLDRLKNSVYYALDVYFSDGESSVNASLLLLGRHGYTEVSYTGEPNYFRENKDNLNECNKVRKEIVKEISNLIKDIKIDDVGVEKYSLDKTGKSKHDTTYFDFKSGDYIKAQCVDYSNEFSKQQGGWYDNLRIAINFKEYTDWLTNETE